MINSHHWVFRKEDIRESEICLRIELGMLLESSIQFLVILASARTASWKLNTFFSGVYEHFYKARAQNPGDDSDVVPPLSIPNREVKRIRAEDTW